jgi:hypothetical protein
MVIVGIAEIFSLMLFAIAAGLSLRAAARPPHAIRTESGRSPAEHAFRRRKSVARQGSLVCLLVGALSMMSAAALALSGGP